MAEQLHRVEVPVAPDDREPAVGLLWALGAEGVWERPDRLVAWVRDPRATTDPRLAAVAAGAITTRLEEDRDWQAAWKATIAPVRAGRTVVVPTWLAAAHEPGVDELTLVLDPGQAFGTGHHATTALCLELLDELDRAGSLADRRVADIGCGSGVLAIAAAARGAEVVAIDLDPAAVTVTRANARANGVPVSVEVGAVEDLALTAEVVVANLISDAVRSNATALVAAATDRLVVSGITEERAEDVLAALEVEGARVVEVRRRDGWIAAVLATTPAGGAAAPPGLRRRGRLARAGLAALSALLLLVACSEPAELDPTTDEEEPGQDPATRTPEQEALLAEVAGMEALLGRVDTELAAAADAADLGALRAAVARADRLLVADPNAGTPAVFPSQDLERNELREAPDALTDTLTRAREVGGALGRSVVEKLRDPIAGDLGSWELDAPGVVATARGAVDGAGDEAAAAAQVLSLDGEGPRAIAWLALASSSEDPALARSATQRAREHIEVMLIALALAVEPPAPGATPDDPELDPGSEELGPGLDPAETDDGDAAGDRGVA
ncbi:MAG: 50S ribosomal protein L11 methyltransferase [Nitriliruptoraceae bacterium]